ncbi:MAG: HIT domain-containing protein [Holophagales bacterium]|nr:MAG: HIT domain-containing protein [Holophagales bacterium]
MRTLFTPWRYAYITRTSPEPGCFFCAAAHTPDEDAERLVVARGRHHLLMLNRHPYSNGHLMVAPFAHLSTLRDAGEEVQRELWPLVLKAQSALERAYRPHGFNLGMNLGTCAGAGVPGHYHFHVVPRWNGDTNFMTVLADTRLVPEDLETARERLRQLLEEEAS